MIGARIAGALALLTLVACGSDRKPRRDGGYVTAESTPDAGPVASLAVAPACKPARSAEPLPAHVQVTSGDVVAVAEKTMFTVDLFNLFKSHCGACHVETKLGNYQVTATSFPMLEQKAIDVMKSDDPAKFMPPPAAGGKKFSDRKPGDPVLELISLLELWTKQGRPRDLFTLPTAEVQVNSGYLLTPQTGEGLTNIGNCIPNKPMVGTAVAKMDELDAKFAAAKQLPERLEETDLIALDSETLARHGVISFAPAYPLFSDHAGKMRYVRVPRGKSIVFDKAKQDFAIPDNTRFYKTFLKKVIDRDGYESYRKIETRIIVVRTDSKNPDGSANIESLFGSYIWNEEETEAVLLRDPLRDGTQFRDRMLTYVVDEPRAQEIRDSKPVNLTYALEVENPGVLRKYAVPGRDRCIQCHMGSPNASFVLGFSPLQVMRRHKGEGGVIDDTGPDELTQVERLIEYGVITGLASPADILPLEASQGSRKPRNAYELVAQGYMLGNCASCHNPRGFPTIKNPELRDALNFLPGPESGVFQFPLERVSPRIKRGRNLDVPIPYITPSLRDIPVEASENDNWKPKWMDCPDKMNPACKGNLEFIDAPWRSLIYRNVDTPFTYSDDFAIFPRMPMHAPGFDCRAPQIMGRWMVSIPAVRTSKETNEDAVPGGTAKPDDAPQPYVEVKPGEMGYDAAAAAATARLLQYSRGRRYNHCPETEDIVDRDVKGLVLVPQDRKIFDRANKTKMLLPQDNVPDRAHWVVTDLTEIPGDWSPRRPDWADVLVKGKVEDTDLSKQELEDLKSVVATLADVRVTKELRDLALEERPFGLWEKRASCNFDKIPRAQSFTGAQRPLWLDKAQAAPDAPVYTQSAGSAVFNMICVNCHGPKADSQGLQADALAMMTGGDARVANLRDGLLGPVKESGGNINRVFGPYAGKDSRTGQLVTAEDWAARYVAWMAMGGTKRRLPQAILDNVGATQVMGLVRSPKFSSRGGSANMLNAAQELCRHTLPAIGSANLAAYFVRGGFDWEEQTALIEKNGDAELWQRLCSFQNRRVVRVPFVQSWTADTGLKDLTLDPVESLYFGDAYPADAPVMDHRGRVVKGLHDDNHFAACIRKPSTAQEVAFATKWLQDNPLGGKGGQVMPFCPDALFEAVDGTPKWKFKAVQDPTDSRWDFIDAKRWAARGAINAGLAVLLYLDQLQKGAVQPKPRFNRCDELPK